MRTIYKIADDIVSRYSDFLEKTKNKSNFSTTESTLNTLHSFLILYNDAPNDLLNHPAWFGLDDEIEKCLIKLTQFNLSNIENKRIIEKIINETNKFLTDTSDNDLLVFIIALVNEVLGFKRKLTPDKPKPINNDISTNFDNVESLTLDDQLKRERRKNIITKDVLNDIEHPNNLNEDDFRYKQLSNLDLDDLEETFNEERFVDDPFDLLNNGNPKEYDPFTNKKPKTKDQLRAELMAQRMRENGLINEYIDKKLSSKYHKLYSVSSTFYSLAQFIGPPKEVEDVQVFSGKAEQNSATSYIYKLVTEVGHDLADDGVNLNEEDYTKVQQLILSGTWDDLDELDKSSTLSMLLENAIEYAERESEEIPTGALKLLSKLSNKLKQELNQRTEVKTTNQANAPNNMQANVPATFNAWKTWADINDILQFAKKYKFDQTLTSNLEKELNNVKSKITQFERNPNRNPNVAANAITAAKAVCKSYKGNSVELSNLWRKLYSSSPSLVRNTWDL